MLRLMAALTMFVGALLLVSGCSPARLGFASRGAPTVTPTWEPVPTFTPTALLSAPPTAVASPTSATATVISTLAPPRVEDAANAANVTPVSAPAAESNGLTPTVTPEATAPPAAPSARSSVTVIVDAANVRNGPGTDYGQIDSALRDSQYPLLGRNAQSDWWQVCCFGGQPGWLYAALVTTQNAEAVAVITDVPPIIPATAEPVALATAGAGIVPEEPVPPVVETLPGEQPAPVEHIGTAGSFDPNAQYQIVHYRVLGFADNNGGIFNKGGQQLIFATVLDPSGNPLDGAVIKDAVGDKLNVVTGSKGPGTAEIKMDWDPYKLYVAADPSGTVTSHVSNQMNNPYPHIPDVVGLLGPLDNEYAICPTPDVRCMPPFYHAHWSYEITFQKVK